MKELPHRIKEEITDSGYKEESSEEANPTEMDYSAKRREENARKKWQLALVVKALRQQGLPYIRIGRKLKIHRTTVKKYESLTGPPDARRRRRSSGLERFLPELQEQVRDGYTIDSIERSLRKKRYKGSNSAIRHQVEAIRRKEKNKTKKETLIYRKQVWKLFWQQLKELSDKEREVLNKVLYLYVFGI
ncbi:hypothetical protein [Virgibacillus senegalensis]|uniref:hypothetical protein n=1 Tax=Virgibacillus senegalensis TaxID=1499679 RepID=UPI00069EC4CD|nr:hypothetical protein [Virgibacillus senegalensis]